MNPDHLTRLLAAGPLRPSGPTAECPDEHQVAAYIEGALELPAHQQLEWHVADCDHCIGLIGALCRQRDAIPAGPAHSRESPPARTQAAGAPGRSRRIEPRWAAAAVLVVVLPLLLQLGRGPEHDPDGQDRPASPATRNLARSAEGLRVLSPGPGTDLSRGQLAFDWTDVAGTPYYEVRILSDDGDVVARQRVIDSQWQPAQLTLERGVEYFVVVDAFPPGEGPVSSRHVPFRLSD